MSEQPSPHVCSRCGKTWQLMDVTAVGDPEPIYVWGCGCAVKGT